MSCSKEALECVFKTKETLEQQRLFPVDQSNQLELVKVAPESVTGSYEGTFPLMQIMWDWSSVSG